MTMVLPDTMQAMAIAHYGAELEKITLPLPLVGDDDVLVKIAAASVNPVDFKIRDGKLKLILDYPMPLVLGNDLAGVVAAVGKNVRQFSVGDAVRSCR